jgi:hypothetical protein
MSLDLSSMSDDDLKALYANTQAIHQNESNGASDSSTIVNPASGAQGSMQVMPNTQKDPGFGVKPSDGSPEDTARAGRDYYTAMNQKYGDPFTAAVAYNWGPGNADKWVKNGAKLEDLPEETLKYAYKMHQQQPTQQPTQDQAAPQTATKPTVPVTASAPQVATGSVTKQGAKPAPQGPQEAPKEQPSFLKTADDFVRGAADTMTFGMADKFAAKMDELTGRTKGTTYDQNLAAERQKDKDGGVANTAGQVAGAFVPGLGVLKAATAPATASRLARAGYGAASGAAMGAVSGVGHNDEDSLVSKGLDALKGGAIGGVIGGVIPAVLPATLEQKVGSYIGKQGGEEQARRAAEATKALKTLSERETQGGVALGAKDANAVGNRYVQEAMDATTDKGLRTALQRGRALTDEDLAKLPPEIADQIKMQQTVQALTAAKPANNNILARAGRMVADNVIPIKPVRDYVVNHVLGGRATREQVIQDLIKQSKVANAVSEKLGPSGASKGLEALRQQAAAQAAARGATVGQNATDGAARAAQRAADKEAADIAKGVMKNGFDRAATQRDTASFIAKGRAKLEAQAQKEALAQQSQRTSALQAQQAWNIKQGQAATARLTTEAQNSAAEAAALAQQRQKVLTTAQSLNAQRGQASTERLTAGWGAEAADAAAKAQQREQALASAQSLNAQQGQAATARINTAQAASKAPVSPSVDLAAQARDKALAAQQALNAKQGRAATERINANVVAGRRAEAAKAEEAATAAAHAEGAAKVAKGEFPDAWSQKGAVETVLSHVDIDPKNAEHLAAIKDTLTKYASESPEKARDVAQFLGKGTKKLEGDKYYGINDRLKEVHGGRTPPQATQGVLSESPGAGALSIEDEMRKIAYQGGKENRQNYAKEVFDAAPTETTRTAVAKLSTLKTPEAREALYNSIHASATDAEKKFMDQKVKHMIHYRKPE